MKNRNMGFNGYSGYAPPPMPYACYPCSGCGGGYDRCGCDDGFNNVNYVPYPVPVPMPSGGTIADPNLYPMPTDELTIIPSTPGQAVNPRDNEFSYAQWLDNYGLYNVNPERMMTFDGSPVPNYVNAPSSQPIVIVVDKDDDDKMDILDWLDLFTSFRNGNAGNPVYVPYPIPVPFCGCSCGNGGNYY
ncbi:unnamed protein product [Leptosia nina]|uniref:Uncharacterized protein n=1 Tax=Leptosia nina TaxID=320188 RepID=A0AAV1JI43_9NEOP